MCSLKLTVKDRFLTAVEACRGPCSRMVEWCWSPGRPPLRLCPSQSGTLLSAGCRGRNHSWLDKIDLPRHAMKGWLPVTHLVDGQRQFCCWGLAYVDSAALRRVALHDGEDFQVAWGRRQVEVSQTGLFQVVEVSLCQSVPTKQHAVHFIKLD